jgi:peroxiredoxin
MKKHLLVTCALAVLLPSNTLIFAADPSAAPAGPQTFSAYPGAADAKTELHELVAKIQAKLKAGKKTEQDLADDLKQFDVLLAEHKGQATDDVAQILMMKAQLYLQILDNTDKGVELITQLKRDFPDTTQGKNADKILASIKAAEASKKVSRGLAEKTKFPDFTEQDVTGKSLSIANYKGKVVLLDFWATWCGPCRGELPNVIKIYNTYHDKGFEIIGISLDSDKSKLTAFTDEQKMPWQQYFDGLGWQNKLAVKYGVQSIPATYLLDGNGMIIAKDVRGEALEAAVAKALTKN